MQDINSPDSDPKICAIQLDEILRNKYDIISSLKEKLDTFKYNLMQEKKLANRFNEKQGAK